MVSKKQAKTLSHVNIVEKDASELMSSAIARYAKSIIEDRAIPDARDGLKPVHRRGLFTMYKGGINATSKHKKMTTIAGRTLEYHPHNSGAIEDALVLLSQDWRQNVTLLDVEGNNGSINGDSPAAGRYIEGRTTLPADWMLNPLSEKTVKMVPTEDNEGLEPEVLPTPLPLLFTNGSSGIAIGVATNIPPHNPVELLKACILVNENPDATLETLMKKVPAPDFPTGGVILDINGVKEMYKTGKGRFIVRGKAEIEGNSLIITEVPYGVSKADLYASMVDTLIKYDLDKKLKSKKDVSKGNGVHIVLEFKKGTDIHKVLDVLYKYSLLQTYFDANNNAIYKGKPMQLGLREYLKIFLEFRREVLFNQLKHEWETKSARGHIVEGLIRLADIADEVVEVVRQSQGRMDVIENLVKMFEFTQEQATAIADMRLHRISNQHVEKLKEEYDGLIKRLSEIATIISTKESFTQYVSEQLNATITSLGSKPRKTKVDKKSNADVQVDLVDIMTAEKTMVVVRPYGAQRMSTSVFENNKEEFGEDIVDAFEAMTNQAIVVFTQEGLAMQRFVSDLESTSIRQQPESWQKSVSSFKSSDKIIGAVLIEDVSKIDENPSKILSISHLGQVKVSPLPASLLSFNNKGYLTRSKVYNGLKLKDDFVEYVEIVPNGESLKEINFKFSSGRRRKELCMADISEQGASGSGVRSVIVKDGEPLKIERV